MLIHLQIHLVGYHSPPDDLPVAGGDDDDDSDEEYRGEEEESDGDDGGKSLVRGGWQFDMDAVGAAGGWPQAGRNLQHLIIIFHLLSS